MKIACISLGCPKNQVDLDGMVHILLSAGHETVAELGEADVILVNTCGFIESAKTEAIENILEACSYKQQNPDLKVIVTGCLAERYRSQIEEEIPEVDAVVGCASNKAIDSIVARLFNGEDHLESYGLKKDFPLGGKRVIGTPAHYAYLKIAEGCNNRCHYCAIPGIRGPLRSRDMADCVAEARWLAGEGVKELIIVAQDPTAYGEADVILVNTCGFIESAKTEAIENILEACSYKQQNPDLKVIVTGCLAERYRSQIEEEIPEVDAVVGCASNKAIDSIVARLFNGEDHLESYGLKKDFPLGGKRVIGTPAHYAYLKIAEGCNNRCHYCAIPGIRGPLRSRDMADCVAEARWLAGEGVKELIIVAQDPTAYGEDWGKPGSICELLDQLNKVQGIEWIRIMYAYPERITDAFIAAMKRNEKVLPYLDLPIQHCNDVILKNMNRRSNRAELLDVIGKLRREIPGITLRTTLIAGFPGETEEQFEDLCNFVKEVQFDRLGCFAYSAEENTVAARMDGQIEQEVKEKRAELVMQIQTGIMAQKQAAKVGQTVRVICDGIDDESGLYLCRTAADAPEVDGNVCVSSEEPLYPGAFYDILVDDSDLYDLYGTVEK